MVMTFTQAVQAAADGYTIVSYAGKRYTAADLAPISCGPRWAIVRAGTMTEKERKSGWKKL